MIYKIKADIVASAAIILSTIAFIPQAYKIYINNMTNDLDFYTFELLRNNVPLHQILESK